MPPIVIAAVVAASISAAASIASSAIQAKAAKKNAPDPNEGLKMGADLRERQKKLLQRRTGLEKTQQNPFGVPETPLGTPTLIGGA